MSLQSVDPNLQHYAAPTIIEREVTTAPVAERFIESSWYTKIEYFHWNERIEGTDFENEDGAFWTLGYVHRTGEERFRVEFFGDQVGSTSQVFDSSNDLVTLHSHTNYFGGRLEYDLLFEPNMLPSISFFTGIGTRFWVRDLPDDFLPDGTFIEGYQETWWTIYPYIGLETRRDLHSGLEVYGMARIGFTAATLERATINEVALYPKPGVTASWKAASAANICSYRPSAK